MCIVRLWASGLASDWKGRPPADFNAATVRAIFKEAGIHNGPEQQVKNEIRHENTNLLLPALARITSLSSALALVVWDLGSRHGGERAVGYVGDARRRPAMGQ